MLFFQTSLLALVILLSQVQAHFHGPPEEHARRDIFQLKTKRAYASTCLNKLQARNHLDTSMERRLAWANEIRASRGLPLKNDGSKEKRDDRRRELSSVSESHQSNVTGLTYGSDVFANDTNSGCVLDPEVTQGPYYVEDELIRSNLTENELGVPLYADVEVIDVSTCETVSGVYLDFWHANATGVYSGVVASGNGDSSDSSNLNNTVLRGIQLTNSAGYVQFQSIFPGYYTGRAVHIHVMVHNTDGTLNSNSTYTDSTISHVGQMFFDQSLISEVNSVSPYSGNTQTLTENEKDSIFESVVDTIDPLMHYAFLGESVEDGILAWTTLVIDTSVEESVQAAATWTENGGVSDSFSGGGDMGGSGGGGSGSAISAASSRSTSTGSKGAASLNAAQTSATSSSSRAATSATQSSSAGGLSRRVPAIVKALAIPFLAY